MLLRAERARRGGRRCPRSASPACTSRSCSALAASCACPARTGACASPTRTCRPPRASPRFARRGALLQQHSAGTLCNRRLVDVDEAAEARDEAGRAAIAPAHAGFSVVRSQDIYIARAEGELALEEELYWALISIYRSPAVMFELTARSAARRKDA